MSSFSGKNRSSLRLLFLIRSLNCGGTEKQLFFLAKGLQDLGLKIAILTFYPGGTLLPIFGGAHIPVFSLNKKNRWDFLHFLGCMKSFIRRFSPNILYSFLVDANLSALPMKLFFPRLKIVWGIRSSFMDFSQFDWLASLNFTISCRFAKFPDLVISNSYAGREFHQKGGYPQNRIRVIQNGIDTDFFHPDPELREKTRKELGISPDNILVGLIARFDPMKDHATFLQGAACLTQTNPSFRFLCVGGGSLFLKNEILQMSKSLPLHGKILFEDEKQDLHPLYNSLDIMVSTSRGEGFSNSLAEAMACGVPCIATNVGDSAKILGDCGEIVPSESPELLAEGITRLWNRKIPPQYVRARIQERFPMKNMISQTLKTLLLLHSENISDQKTEFFTSSKQT